MPIFSCCFDIENNLLLISRSLFNSTPSLSDLSLQRNVLRSLPSSSSLLRPLRRSLRTLDLGENQVEGEMEAGWLEGMAR